MKIAITLDTTDLTRKLRIISAKLTELADALASEPAGHDERCRYANPDHAGECEHQPAEPGPPRQEINNTSATTERRWSPHAAPPATPFGFGR
jgi:hypothetical protein